MKKILQLKPAIVDIQKIDGFCALHLAALNDNLNVAKTLIEKVSQFTKFRLTILSADL